MNEYFVPTNSSETEFTEKRSRFIGRVWKTETEQEALEHIKEMREKHWDATHNVYAYIIRDEGVMRYSDDGEPGGTAGMPVLEVFRRENITNFCCVVTRYFGGVLLGAGGLVRAYANSAKLALDAAGVSIMRRWIAYSVPCPYQLFERVRQEITALEGVVENSEFTDIVTMSALLPETRAADFEERIVELSAGGIKPIPTGDCFKPVSVR